MNRFLKNSIVAAALAATTVSAIPTAQAGERHHRRQHVVQKADNTDLIVAGLLGLAVGAIVVTALNEDQGGGRNNGDLSVNYFPPAPGETVSYGWEKPERPTENDPRNRRWYKYCEDSYRDFKRNATVGGNERFSCAYR